MLEIEGNNLKSRIQDYLADINAPFAVSEDSDSPVIGDIQIGENFFQLSVEKDPSGLYLAMSMIVPIEGLGNNQDNYNKVLNAMNHISDDYISVKMLAVKGYGVMVYSVVLDDTETGLEERLIRLSKSLNEASSLLERELSGISDTVF